jgi:two-component system, cell cycle response regulator CtrA
MRVLLVEDDQATAAAVKRILRSEGFACETAELGEDGIEIGKASEFDLIILDLNLPDIGGYEVLRRLRSSDIGTPVLILSGLSHIDHRIKGFGIGADDFMSKPFDRRELIARIHAITRRSNEPKTVIGNVSMNFKRRTVRIDDKPVELTTEELELFELLAKGNW